MDDSLTIFDPSGGPLSLSLSSCSEGGSQPKLTFFFFVVCCVCCVPCCLPRRGSLGAADLPPRATLRGTLVEGAGLFAAGSPASPSSLEGGARLTRPRRGSRGPLDMVVAPPRARKDTVGHVTYRPAALELSRTPRALERSHSRTTKSGSTFPPFPDHAGLRFFSPGGRQKMEISTEPGPGRSWPWRCRNPM